MMMNRTLLLFLLMCLSGAVIGQETGDTKVVLSNKLSSEDNFLKAGEVLNDMQYMVRKSDPVFKSLESRVVAYRVKRSTYKQIFLVTAKNGEVVITSWFKRRGKGKDLATFEDKAPEIEAFDKMTELAEMIGGEVTYSK